MSKNTEYFDQMAKCFDSDPMKIQRAQEFAASIRNEIEISPNFTGFEYGCGTGLVSFFLQPFMKKIVLADNSPGMLEELNKKIATNNISNMSALNLDLVCDAVSEELTGQFNVIFTLMTMHHILDIASVVKRFYSLLTQPGYLCIGDLEKEDGSFHGRDFVGHNGFDRKELTDILSAAGFINIRFQEFFQMKKSVGDGKMRTFPLFFMCAEKR